MRYYSNLSDMMMRGWISRYSDIVKEFGFSKSQDSEAAILLDSIIKKPISVEKINKKLNGKNVFVIGSGPSLDLCIPILKKHKKNIKIAADSAVAFLMKNKIFPDIVVTDLDGDEKSLKKIGKTNAIMIVHAHGDNMNKLHLAENFENCLGTTQGKIFGKLLNFGGFTDGDRSVFLANAFGAKKIILFGMDFGRKIGKFSGTEGIDKKIKLKKLKKAKILLQWLAKKSHSKLYTTSTPIKGFKKISFGDVSDIIIT